MKVLLVGGGGREHALAWKLATDDPSVTIIAAPGNPGIATLARCVPIAATDIDGLVSLASAERPDLTIVGPEAPLAAGIVDRFRGSGYAIFGPTRAAAQIETSKAFAKDLLLAHEIPTARAVVCRSSIEADEAIGRLGAPVVVKASGLAAGKGVVVCDSVADARAAVRQMMERRAFGEAGDTVLVEEYMEGEELSLFAITDGTRAVPLVPAQDHKRLLAGDVGPNTGGMGAYAPVHLQSGAPELGGTSVVGDALERIILPTLFALRSRGTPFTGLLYAGLMLTRGGPRVVEFNCRFGDPETEAVLPVLAGTSSLLDLLGRVARGEALGDDRAWAEGYAVATVLASAGYPDAPRTGDAIALPEADDAEVLVFHAGTRRAPNGDLLTSGGRVFAVTGLGGGLEEAHRRSREYASAVTFAGKQFRTDIGWRELARRAGAARG